MNFVGRELEIKEIEKRLLSNRSEMIMVHGRRRVGKTRTISKILNDEKIQDGINLILNFSGEFNQTTEEIVVNLVSTFKNQLFMYSTSENFKHKFFEKESVYLLDLISKVKTTEDFFDFLSKLLVIYENWLSKQNKKGKMILFFDELSYLSKGNSFVNKLAGIWEKVFNWNRDNIKIILSGSVIFWLNNHVKNAKGGLHNRVTLIIYLKPFSYEETIKFFKTNFYDLSDREILNYHLIFGGVPYYYTLLNNERSFKENINALFSLEGRLRNEFENMCYGLFSEKKYHKRILEIMGNKKSKAFSTNDLLSLLKLDDKTMRGTLLKDLKELEECGLIRRNLNISNNKKDVVYSISDSFVYFYINYLSKNEFSIKENNIHQLNGYLFELFCFNEKEYICNKLGITGLGLNNIEQFYFRNNKTQIDMLYKRPDNVVILFECKFKDEELTINNNFYKEVDDKVQSLYSSKEFEKFKKKGFSIKVVILTYNGYKLSNGVNPSVNDWIKVNI